MKKVLVKEKKRKKQREERDRKKEQEEKRTISNHLRMSMWFPIESNARKTNADILRIQLQFSCVSHLLHKWANASHTHNVETTLLNMLYVLASALHLCELVFLSDRFSTQNCGLCFVLELDKLQLCSLVFQRDGAKTICTRVEKREPKIMNQTNQRMIWTFMRKHFVLRGAKKLKTLTRISHSVSSMLIFKRNSSAFWWTFLSPLLTKRGGI